MKRFAIIAAILVVVGLVVAKNTKLCSYVTTMGTMAQKQFKNNIAPEFEIERLKNEIAKLDSDVDQLINKEAELAVDLKADKAMLAQREKALARTKETLVKFAKQVKDNENSEKFSFTNFEFTPKTAKAKLAHDYKLFQSQEASVQSLNNLIAAKESQYNTLVNQRNQFVTQKETFQARVEQLHADWATLKNESNTPVASFDTSRITTIDSDLKHLQRRIDIAVQEKMIKDGIPSFATAPETDPEPGIDPDVVLNALQNSAVQDDSVTVAAPKEE